MSETSKSYESYAIFLTLCDESAPRIQGVLQVRFTSVLVGQAALHITSEEGSVCPTNCAGCSTAWLATHATSARHTRSMLVGCLEHNITRLSDVVPWHTTSTQVKPDSNSITTGAKQPSPVKQVHASYEICRRCQRILYHTAQGRFVDMARKRLLGVFPSISVASDVTYGSEIRPHRVISENRSSQDGGRAT